MERSDGGTVSAFVANSRFPLHKGTLAERLMGFSISDARAETTATPQQSFQLDGLPLQKVNSSLFLIW